MKICPNHSDKKAEYVCRSCGNYYCELCLTEGGDYYYCNKPKCLERLEAAKVPKIISTEIVCPNCSVELNPDEEEQETGIANCTECESLIDFTADPPVVKKRKEYTQLFSSLNQGDIGILKSILDNEGIDYYVFGENFLSIDPLIQPARFFILNEQINEARKLIKDFDFKIFGTSAKNEEDE
jgi:hypothetical protein